MNSQVLQINDLGEFAAGRKLASSISRSMIAHSLTEVKGVNRGQVDLAGMAAGKG